MISASAGEEADAQDDSHQFGYAQGSLREDEPKSKAAAKRGKAAAKVAAASDSTAGRRQAAASRVTGLNEEELSALPDDLQACARQLAYIPDAFKNLSPEKILDGQMLGRSVVSVGSCQTQDLDLAAVICYLSS